MKRESGRKREYNKDGGADRIMCMAEKICIRAYENRPRLLKNKKIKQFVQNTASLLGAWSQKVK